MKHLAFAGIALLLSAGASAAADIPQVAVDTCLKHADAYTGAAAGSAKSTGKVEGDIPWFGDAGGNFRLTVDAGGMALNCTVSPDGKLIALAPAN